jgi:hypothetical protein
MENEEQYRTARLAEATARLVSACQRYTELTGRYLYIDIYPISPTFKETSDYTYELTEVKDGDV